MAGREDLKILAKQGIAPSKAVGTPPRMTGYGIRGKVGVYDVGGKSVPVELADEDGGSALGDAPVLGQMANRAADRVQASHDEELAKIARDDFLRDHYGIRGK